MQPESADGAVIRTKESAHARSLSTNRGGRRLFKRIMAAIVKKGAAQYGAGTRRGGRAEAIKVVYNAQPPLLQQGRVRLIRR